MKELFNLLEVIINFRWAFRKKGNNYFKIKLIVNQIGKVSEIDMNYMNEKEKLLDY